MGDLIVEFSTRLDRVAFTSLHRDRLEYSAIQPSIGGTAGNLALSARDHFADVNVLSRVGGDAFGRAVLDKLEAAGIRLLLSPLPDASTALSIYLRDTASVAPNGVRLIVVDQGANRFVEPSDVDRHADAIQGSDVFFLDGYCFLDDPRREAAQHAMEVARHGGVPIVLDLVPHDAHRYFSAAEVSGLVELADILIIEVRTIRRILGLPSPEEVRDARLAHEACEFARRLFPGTIFMLRFGAGNIDESLHLRPGGTPQLRRNGYLGDPNPRGFGDRLTAADLAEVVVARDG
jgi:sugar/nucleoside kinase (ribokinase family)